MIRSCCEEGRGKENEHQEDQREEVGGKGHGALTILLVSSLWMGIESCHEEAHPLHVYIYSDSIVCLVLLEF